MSVFNFELGSRAKIKRIRVEEKNGQIEVRPRKKIPVDYSVLDKVFDDMDFLLGYIKELEREED